MKEISGELSIGDVSKATGLSVYTLRQWERRYGFPKAIRRNSGHRRYEEKELGRLKLVAQALDLGHRAHKVVPMSVEKLLDLLQSQQGGEKDPLIMNQWLKLVKQMDEKAIIHEFNKDWQAFGPVGFVELRVGPFLDRLGMAWRFQEISVTHEHYFSELLVAFLSSKWRDMNQKNIGETFILASPSGEEHILGLHLVAVVLTASGKRVVFLGASTPINDMVAACQSAPVDAVCLSFSRYFSTTKAKKEVLHLREQLNKQVDILVGGQNAPTDLDGVRQFTSLTFFYDFINHQWNPGAKLWAGPSAEI